MCCSGRRAATIASLLMVTISFCFVSRGASCSDSEQRWRDWYSGRTDDGYYRAMTRMNSKGDVLFIDFGGIFCHQRYGVVGIGDDADYTAHTKFEKYGTLYIVPEGYKGKHAVVDIEFKERDVWIYTDDSIDDGELLKDLRSARKAYVMVRTPKTDDSSVTVSLDGADNAIGDAQMDCMINNMKEYYKLK